MPANFFELQRFAATGLASPYMTAYDKLRARALFPQSYPSTTVTGVPPLSFKSNGQPLSAWSMLGNSRQNGTPTPDDPIMPEFVGERTANLFGVAIEQGTFNIETGEAYGSNERVRSTDFITQIGQMTVNTSSNNDVVIYIYNADGTYHKDESITAWQSCPYTFTITSGKKFKIAFRKPDNSRIYPSNVSGIMLNTGSTAKPYEPYGYKLPITCGSQTTPIYLGQVQTLRKVKKLVLTGEENWSISSSWEKTNTTVFFVSSTDARMNSTSAIYTVCSHFVQRSRDYIYQNDEQCSGLSGATPAAFTFRVHKSLAATTTDWKQYLADQYANGTPVCVWYVLADPGTSIVNEPLAKIGDYVDTVASTNTGAPSIPTAKGQNTLTVDTDLQPSSMTITT